MPLHANYPTNAFHILILDLFRFSSSNLFLRLKKSNDDLNLTGSFPRQVIDKIRLDEVSRAHLFQEVRCMKLVQHPNVVRLYEVIDTQTKLYLILELADGGDMYDYIMK